MRSAAAAVMVLAGVAVAGVGHGREGFEYAEDELPFSLNPLHEAAMPETRLNELLFEGLWGPGYDTQPELRLAESYELAPDGKGMTVYLKPDLRWSDGTPLSAEDVVFTVSAFQHPRTGSPDRSRLGFIKKAKAVDSTTVKLVFEQPEPSPLEKLNFKILPAHRFSGPAVPRSDRFWREPTTSGPFMLEAQDLGTWSLVPNPHALRSPELGSVKVREMPDKNQQVSSLGYGYIQAMIQVPGQYLPEIERSRNADLVPYQSKSWWYLGMNHDHPLLREPAVRNALARVLDLDESLQLIGEGDRISGPFVPSSKFYNHSESLPVLEQDEGEAAGLLETIGWGLDGEDWQHKGEPVSLRLFYRSGLGEQGQIVALNLQAQLRRFGIAVADPIAMDKAVWNERVFGVRDFDLVLDSWSFDKNENIYDLFHSKGAQNYIGYRSPAVDLVLDKALVEPDPAAKVAYLREAHRLLHQEQPYVFLWSLRSYTALRREVEGAYVQPFYYFSQFPDWTLRASK